MSPSHRTLLFVSLGGDAVVTSSDVRRRSKRAIAYNLFYHLTKLLTGTCGDGGLFQGVILFP